MRCPVCGAKLVAKQVCPYCKITDTQILNASNKKVKEYRKTGNKDLIHYTNIIPNDVSRVKLLLFTIFLGWIGVNHFYIKRPIRAWFSVIATVGSFSMMLVVMTIGQTIPTIATILNLLYEVLFYSMAINVLLWVGDIFGCIFKSMKIPVVLGKKE
ncbi:MAG: NINE protein [Clostridia bacterium]|nr:NINE protein [Clostridia bacterium]